MQGFPGTVKQPPHRERIATAARPLLKTIVATAQAALHAQAQAQAQRRSAQNGLPIAPRRAE